MEKEKKKLTLEDVENWANKSGKEVNVRIKREELGMRPTDPTLRSMFFGPGQRRNGK